jgi:TonB family protein
MASRSEGRADDGGTERLDARRICACTVALAIHAGFALLQLIPLERVAEPPRPPRADAQPLELVEVRTIEDAPLPAVGPEPSRAPRGLAAPRARHVDRVATRAAPLRDAPPSAAPSLADPSPAPTEPALPSAPLAIGAPTTAAPARGDTNAAARGGSGHAFAADLGDDLIGFGPGGRGRGGGARGYKPIAYRGVPYMPERRQLPTGCRYERGCLLYVRVFVRADGTRGAIQLLKGSGSPQFDRLMLRYAKGWKFHPRRVDGTPVDGWAVIPVFGGPSTRAVDNY